MKLSKIVCLHFIISNSKTPTLNGDLRWLLQIEKLNLVNVQYNSVQIN